MHGFRRSILSLTAFAALALSVHASAAPKNTTPSPGAATPPSAAAPAAAPTTLSVPVTLPQPFEATIASISALATGAGAALKTYKTDARTLAIRLALSTALNSAKAPVGTITLSPDTLGEAAILCDPRQNYMTNSVYLNYLNTLVQNINAVSIKAKTPTDIPTALKLLLATTNYNIADKVSIKSTDIANLAKKTEASCKKDLGSYAMDYYGLIPGAENGKILTEAISLNDTGGVNTFAFLGPVGALVDTFLSILQPVLIDWATLADKSRRQKAIIDALTDTTIQAKINTTGTQLADAMDKFSAASRYSMVGAFVEQLVLIRDMTIDVSNVEDCKNFSTVKQADTGVPNPAFIGCFNAAWTKIQKNVASLNTAGDSYDTLADANSVSAKQLFAKILADWTDIAKATQNGKAAVYTQAFLEDLTEFIAFAQAITGAASQSNLSALDKAAAAAAK